MGNFVLGLICGALIGAGGMWYMQQLAPEKPAVAIADTPQPSETRKSRKSRKRRGKKRRRAKNRAHVDAPVADAPDEPLLDTPVAPVLSNADRAQVWRGDRVSIGKREVDGDSNSRGLTEAEIERGVGPKSSAFVQCIHQARGDAELAAPVKVKFKVTGGGQISAVRVRAPKYLVDHGLLRCVRGVTRGTHFTKTGAPTVVELPFSVR